MKGFSVAATIASIATLFTVTAYSSQDPRGLAHPALLATSPQSWESCEEMHDAYVARFESAPGFGMSRMGQPPMLDRSGTFDAGRTSYSIVNVELVGLLYRETPVVYTPFRHGSRPDGLTFKDRDLNDFERSSLEAFRAGKGIASTDDEKAGTLACMGALRAKDTCLQCHRTKKVGDLLGAFTYNLRVKKSR
jgi:hypothetical protein